MASFYLVIGNRDKLNLPGRQTLPIWEVLDGRWPYFLTSLWYARRTGTEVGSMIPPWAEHSIYDCGAWSYADSELPRWSPAECWELYDTLARPGDTVMAPDHMILPHHDQDEAARRQTIVLDNAREFLALHGKRPLKPMAAVHGQTLAERIAAAEALLAMGYRYLAIGGIARLASARKRALSIVEAIARIKLQEPFWLHVLGISAPSYWDAWDGIGVDSFDGTGPFRPAFFGCYIGSDGQEYSVEKDGRNNSKKQPPVSLAPECDCPACTLLASYGISTRTFGSNEHNMGRAVHNVNMYLRRLRDWEPASVPVQRGLL